MRFARRAPPSTFVYNSFTDFNPLANCNYVNFWSGTAINATPGAAAGAVHHPAGPQSHFHLDQVQRHVDSSKGRSCSRIFNSALLQEGTLPSNKASMDPLTALSLAGTIVQFVDFGGKLLKDGRELYKSTTGSLTVNDELELIVADLQALIVKFQHSICSPATSGCLPEADQDLADHFTKICDEATKIAIELATRLHSLKVKEKNRIWSSIHQAVKSAWSRDELFGMVERLSTLREAMETRLLVSLR